MDEAIDDILNSLTGCVGDATPIAELVELVGPPEDPSPLDRDRLSRLVRTGSSASCSSQWEDIKDEYSNLLTESGDNGYSPTSPIKDMLAEGDALREERRRLHIEHLKIASEI